MDKKYKIFLIVIFFILILFNYITDYIFWHELDLSIRRFLRYAFLSFIVVVFLNYVLKYQKKTQK